MAEKNPADRRRFPRVDRATLVHVTSLEKQGFEVDLATGRTLNISLGGMRLELQHHYPLGLRSVLGLSLALGGEILDVHGVVMYLQIVDEQRCAVGIQFKDLSEDGRRMIQRFIDSDPKQLPGLKPQPPRPLEEKT